MTTVYTDDPLSQTPYNNVIFKSIVIIIAVRMAYIVD